MTDAQPTSVWRDPPARRSPGSRRSLLAQGVLGAALAAVLYAATVLDADALLAATFAVQMWLVVGVLKVLDAPAPTGALAIGVAAALAADLVVAQDGRTAGLAGVTALAFVAALLYQLARRGRTQVTESLADSLVAVVLACAAACLLAALQLSEGPALVRLALVAAGCALLVGRAVDAVAGRPRVRAGATRGWPGAALSLAAGVGGCSLVNHVLDRGLAPHVAVLLGLGVAATVIATDLLCDLALSVPGEAEAVLPAGRSAAVVTMTLPLVAVGPVVLFASRLLA